MIIMIIKIIIIILRRSYLSTSSRFHSFIQKIDSALLVCGDAIFQATVLCIIERKGRNKKRLPQRLKEMFRLAEYYHPDSASATNTTGRKRRKRSRIRISNTCPRLLGLILYALFFGRSLLTLVAGLFKGFAKRFISCFLFVLLLPVAVLVFGSLHRLYRDVRFLPPLGFGVGNGSFLGVCFGLLVVTYFFDFFFFSFILRSI